MRRPSPVGALLVEGFTSRLAFGVLTFALPLYARDMGMSIASIGLLASFAAMVSLALKPFTGALTDRWGIRRTLLGALAARGLLCLGYLVATVPVQLFVVRGVHGVADAVRDPAVHALIAQNGGKRSMASTFGWYQTAKTTAGSVGKSVAGLLLATAMGFPLAFTVAFVLALLPLLVLAWARPWRGGATQQLTASQALTHPTEPPRVRRTERPRSPGLVAYAGLGFFVSGTASMLTALLPIIATEYAGLSTAEAGLIYLLTPALAFTGPLWGWISDRVSRRLVLSVRGVANVSSSLVFLLVPSAPGVWTGKALDDLGKAAFRPAWGSLMADVANRNPRARARAMGCLTAGEDAGAVFGPVFAGLVWSLWGVPALLLARVALALFSEGYAQRLERRQRDVDTDADRGRVPTVGVADPSPKP